MVGGDQSGYLGYSSVNNMFNALSGSKLGSINPGYNDDSAAMIRLGYRGLPLILETQANSPAITLMIPALNEVHVFDAQATRDLNRDDLKEYLKNSRGNILDRLQKALARYSPIDPVAGNPGSMQFQMVASDFERGFASKASSIKNNNGAALGLRLGRYSSGSLSNSIYTLPLSYSWEVGEERKDELMLALPISYGAVGGAKSFGANIGLGYKKSINDSWSLTPSIGYGISGSVDLGSVASMVSGSLTSNYVMDFPGYSIALGNMIGVYQTLKLSGGGYSSNPDIRNHIFRNGIMLAKPLPLSFFGSKASIELSYVNTIYTGSDIYSKKYHEFGITLGTDRREESDSQNMRVGLNYLKGENGIHGFSVSFGYWF